MTETKIYVGLNDSVTLKQEHNTEILIDILKEVCKQYQVAFTFSLDRGGYMHEDGRYTEEATLVITLIEVEPDLVNEIAKDLCVFFHQESVMITEDRVRAYYVSESLLEGENNE